VPAPVAFKESSTAAYRGVPGLWQPARPADATLKGKWWEAFGDPELNALEEQLNINNQTLAQYFQNFMAARAQVNEARAGYFPTVSVAPSVTNVGGGTAAAGAAVGSSTGSAGAAATTSTNSLHQTTVFALPVEASWAPDLWGRVKNTVHEFQYAAQVSAADLENERLTEQAALAQYFFELRGQDSLQKVYDDTIAADRKALELARSRAVTGVDSEEAAVQAQVTLENAEEAGAGVATNRALYEHVIATLIGRNASSFALPVKYLETPLPAIPVDVPSKLLQRRPDIAAAERAMAQANAVIGVEKAAFYPNLTLAGSGGLESTNLGNLFSLPALFWSLGASATETIFDGGLRSATVAQYVAMYRANVAAYRQTVLAAFQQVEDSMATLRVLSRQTERQGAAVKSAQKYLEIALYQYQTGLQPYLNVLTAQNLLLGDEQTAVTLKVNTMVAAVQLIQALGGGWDIARLPSAPDVTAKDTPKRLLQDP
jgi:NodT family efflux transporter outer membrane factor (OMF) lipoprotein